VIKIFISLTSGNVYPILFFSGKNAGASRNRLLLLASPPTEKYKNRWRGRQQQQKKFKWLAQKIILQISRVSQT
jgi:hypothetical protein